MPRGAGAVRPRRKSDAWAPGERLTLIALTEQEYLLALDLASSAPIVGAAAYDALIAHCALKPRADTLLTWDVRDFTRLGPAIARLAKTPLEL